MRVLSLLGITVVLSSCLFPYGSYYKPSYDHEGQPTPTIRFLPSSFSFFLVDVAGTHGYFGSYLGPRNTIIFRAPHSALLGITVRIKDQHKLELSFRAMFPREVKVQFTSDSFYVTDHSTGSKRKVTAKHLLLTHFGPANKNKNLRLAEVVPLTFFDTAYFTVFQKEFSPENLTLHLPPILNLSDNQRLPIQTIELTRSRNSHEEHPLYDKGLWFYDSKGEKKFWVEASDFKISGHFLGAKKTYEDKATLSGFVFVFFRKNLSWQFESDQIMLESQDLSEVHHDEIFLTPLTQPAEPYRFFNQAKFSSFTSQVLFQSKFKGPVSIRVVLPPLATSMIDGFTVEIPPMLINGEEFVIKPITFRLRKYDFGFQPLFPF
ncbi:hypothetical protein [Nitrospina gracilis]|nr:hypothetical protein [Nitrospina gracilis]